MRRRCRRDLRRRAIPLITTAVTRAVLLLALLTAACASGQAAPISYGSGGARTQETAGTSPRASQSAQRSDRGGAAIEYRGAQQAQAQQQLQAPSAAVSEPEAPTRASTVQETPDWAAGEGTPLSTYALQPDEAQPYDPAQLPRTHRVGAEESLYDIATRYQVPLRALIDQNNLEPPFALSEGRVLQLPPPRFHTVARGENFEDVARAYNVDVRSLALLNRMEAPYAVRAGDRIVLPAMARAAPEVIEPTPAPIASPPRTNANARFAMPMRGAVVGRFGPMQGGGRLEGIEIGGREGDAVAAAADGEVVYAGDDLPAYGTLVLVRHADNYVTAYGFNRRALVREGQSVRAGQQIAELGARADGRARLLFQVRRGSEVIDPAPLLGIGD